MPSSSLTSWMLRLKPESILVPAVFACDACHTYSSVSIFYASVLCLVVAWMAARFLPPVDDGHSGKEHAQRSQRLGLPFVGALLLVSALILHSVGLLVSGASVVFVGVVIERIHLSTAVEITRRIQASLLVLLGSLLLVRWLPLCAADVYGPMIMVVSDVVSVVFGTEQPGQFTDTVVIDGAEVHVSHFLGLWAFIPITYASLINKSQLMWNLVKTAVAILIVLILTYVFVWYVVSHASPSLLLNGWTTIVQLLMGYCLSLGLWHRSESVPKDSSLVGLPIGALVPLAIAICLVMLPPGAKRGPLHVAMDENHGKWETAYGTFDTVTYGRDTVYNYRLMKDWLAARCQVSPVNDDLRNVEAEIIIVKMPTTYFKDEEKQVSPSGTIHSTRMWS